MSSAARMNHGSSTFRKVATIVAKVFGFVRFIQVDYRNVGRLKRSNRGELIDKVQKMVIKFKEFSIVLNVRPRINVG